MGRGGRAGQDQNSRHKTQERSRNSCSKLPSTCSAPGALRQPTAPASLTGATPSLAEYRRRPTAFRSTCSKIRRVTATSPPAAGRWRCRCRCRCRPRCCRCYRRRCRRYRCRRRCCWPTWGRGASSKAAKVERITAGVGSAAGLLACRLNASRTSLPHQAAANPTQAPPAGLSPRTKAPLAAPGWPGRCRRWRAAHSRSRAPASGGPAA